MGYQTNARGVIAIEPPLTWAQIQDSKYRPTDHWDDDCDTDLVFHVTEVPLNTEHGVLLARTATGIKQRPVGDPRNYEIVTELQDLVDTYPDHEFIGRFDLEGEESGDQWRLKVVDRKATRFDPVVTWPEGSQ